ncbi:MAG: SDR family NAD(P)-dependent oxidoreductase [Sandaracinaceae bacterium]
MHDLDGRVVLVTGASSGIGEAAAGQLAERGAHVVMLCRSEERGAAARDRISRTAPSGSTELLVADLSRQAEVRAAADAFFARLDRLHSLINYAGVGYQAERTLTEDGEELTFAVNVVAPFLLSRLLEPALRRAADDAPGAGRIVHVAGMMHGRVPLNFGDPTFAEGWGYMDVASHSKLALIMLAMAEARRLEGSGVTVTSLHPGAARTNVQKGFPFPLALLVGFARLFFPGPGAAARHVVRLAVDPDLAAVTGTYFMKAKPALPAPMARDEDAQDRLVALLEARVVASGDATERAPRVAPRSPDPG